MKLSYSFSNKDECEMIHSYSIDILENVGMTVHSEKARSVFKSKGAKVDNKQVYLSKKIIEEYIHSVPNSFSIHSTNHSFEIGKGNLCTIPPYGATSIRLNDEFRPSTRDDFINLSKLNHMNENMSMSCPYIVDPSDIPSQYRQKYMIAMSLKYSDKPTFSITNNKMNARKSIELIKNYCENYDDYILLGNVNLTSPLIMSENTAEVIIVHGEENQPVMIGCGSGLSGLTAPPTLASNFLLNNAATLSGIILAQMVRPGLPVVYGFPLFGVDPYHAHVSVGHPSTALFTMAATEMGRYYKIPIRSGGVYTDSKILDYQSGFESFMNLFSSLHSKTDLIMHTYGMENSLNTVNYNKYILDEDLFKQVLLYLGGFEINAASLMLNEIKKTGSSGNYINIPNLNIIREQYLPYSYKDSDTTEDLLKRTSKIIKDRLDSYKPIQMDKRQRKLLESCLPCEYID